MSAADVIAEALRDHRPDHFGYGPWSSTCRCECYRCMSALSGCICIGCTCHAGDLMHPMADVQRRAIA